MTVQYSLTLPIQMRQELEDLLKEDGRSLAEILRGELARLLRERRLKKLYER